MDVHLIESNAELARFEDGWRRLFGASGEPSLFLSYEWTATWWRHFANGREPVVVVAGDRDRPAGLLPLRRAWRSGRVFGARTFESLAAGPSDATGALMAGDVGETARAMAEGLVQHGGEWDLLDLRDLVIDDERCDALIHAFDEVGVHTDVEHDNPCPVLALSGDFDSLCQEKIGRRKRRGNRRALNRLADLGELRFRRATAAGEAQEAFERILALNENQAYHGEQRVRPFDGETGAAFFRDVLDRFSERGWLSLHLLEVGGRLVAYDIGFRYAGRHSCYYGGYDPELANLSPGRLLTLEVLRDAYAAGLTEMDFLRGDEGWKREWTEGTRHTLRLRARRAGLESRLRVALQR